MSNCSVCNQGVTDDLLSKRYIDPANPSKILGPWCPDCLPSVRICNFCRSQTVEAENNPHGYPKTSRLTPKGQWACSECMEHLQLCQCCGSEGSLVVGPDGKKVCPSCRETQYSTCGCCSGEKIKDSFITDAKSLAERKGLFRKYGSVCKDCFEAEKSRFKKYKVKSCPNCPKYHTEEGDYCKSCQNTLPTCDCCGDTTHNYRAEYLEGSNSTICSKCQPKIKTCESCHQKTLKAKKVKGKWVCGNCRCGKPCRICMKSRTDLEDGVCSVCKSSYVENICNNCGMIKDAEGNCRVCRDKGTYGYTNKPPIYFNYLKGEQPRIFFGIENEVTFGSNSEGLRLHQKNLYKSYDPSVLITKYDASISGQGFEVVTQPMSLKYFNKMDVAGLFSSNIEPHRSCGMHIHISRSAFNSEVHLLKVTKFIYDHEEEVNKVVGRSYTGYNAKLEGKASSAILKMKKRGYSGDRSARVNLTGRDTVEFRMFAGCTTEREMRRRVEFLHALVSWTRECSLRDVGDFENLKAYIMKNTKAYPTASKYYGV